MRIVLDTNVLVSAARKQQSIPGTAVLMVERCGGLLKSLATEQKLLEVIARPYLASLIDPEVQTRLGRVMAAAELVTITERIAACRDPTDDKFLELAVNGDADLIVSGDGISCPHPIPRHPDRHAAGLRATHRRWWLTSPTSRPPASPSLDRSPDGAARIRRVRR
jgi:putative PIN family toxin of toxin-antitoxin system